MASPITKNSGVDNFTPRLAGTCEVWWYGKHADIVHGTGEVLNDEGVNHNSQAFKIAMQIATDMPIKPFAGYDAKVSEHGTTYQRGDV